MTLREIADGIQRHLMRMEADPAINVERNGLHWLYHAHAIASGRYVGVRYRSFQGTTYLTKAQAERYLRALEEGSEQRHFEVFRRAAS